MAVYLCNVCGHAAFETMPESCPVCGAVKFVQNDAIFEESMEKSKEGAHKHIPSIRINKHCGIIPEECCTDVIVRIGETLHPMTDAHFIGWIDCYVDGIYVSRQLLTPSVHPSSLFHVKIEDGKKAKVVSFCNLHGYWQAEAEL